VEAKELRELASEELDQKLNELREELFKLRLRASVTRLENPARIRQLRRDIARVQTVKREFWKQTAGAKEESR